MEDWLIPTQVAMLRPMLDGYDAPLCDGAIVVTLDPGGGAILTVAGFGADLSAMLDARGRLELVAQLTAAAD
jgi:hypothetical protein